MDEAEDRGGQRRVLRWLQAMGLEAELLPGGRSVLARVPLRPVPFSTPEGPRYHEAVRFATVGPAHVKCLEPRALFFLPLISISGCSDAAGIEERIRAAWTAHGESLERAQRALGRIGVMSRSDAEGALLSVEIGLDDAAARIRLADTGRVALPGRGPLSGIPLQRAEDRLFAPDPGCESPADWEISITNRLEDLARERRRAAERRRTARVRASGQEEARRPMAPWRRQHRLLLVGPELAGDESLWNELRREGFLVTAANTSGEALKAFDAHSFDLVLAETDLGRADGIELVPAIESLPGVAHLPVVLVDDRMRSARRDAARLVGAAGYLVHPLRVPSIAAGLDRMVQGARGRRYDRFGSLLAVAWEGGDEGDFTTAISRRGMFVRTERKIPLYAVEHCEVSLPEVGETLRLEAQALYRIEEAGAIGPGIGLRFLSFPDGNEATLIEYVRTLTDDRVPD